MITDNLAHIKFKILLLGNKHSSFTPTASPQSQTTPPSGQVPFPPHIGLPGHVAMSQWSPVKPLLHSHLPVLPIQVPLPWHVVELSHTTKKVLWVHYWDFLKIIRCKLTAVSWTIYIIHAATSRSGRVINVGPNAKALSWVAGVFKTAVNC